MKKVELLSPVGNMETLYFAVHNGCDAVYFAGKKFGARKFANNFDEEEIKEAIRYCHIYGVKVYMTVNTLIYDNELDEVLDYIKFLHENNVDALIMQDIGLIRKTKELYPNLEIHISTQNHNHNIDGLNFFKSLGATRVVLDREMSLEEIKRLNTDLELEVFIHGALCVSYSGCCLFSALNGGRSGNRGECVASCRLKYDFYKNNEKQNIDGEYPLSTKELNILDHVKELIEAGITSFKIEGRMKSPEYVGFVTKLYRTMIDKYYNNEEMTLNENDIFNLKKLFNREFTKGYLFNDEGLSLMNIKTPNHQGTDLAKIIDIDKKYIKIELLDNIKQEDGIRLPNNEGMIVNRLYNKKLLLVNSLNKGEIGYIDNKYNITKKGIIKKTIDKVLLDELKKYEEKKILIDMKLIIKKNNNIFISITDNTNTISKEGFVVEQAEKNPTTKERIIEQVSKLGNTPFKLNNIEIDVEDDVFVPIKLLNDLRREVVEELIEKRTKSNKEIIINKNNESTNYIKKNRKEISVLVRNENQLKTVLDLNIKRIYTTDYNLYLKYKDKINIYLKLQRTILKHQEFNNERLLVTEIGAYHKYKDNNKVIGDYSLNVLNHLTMNTIDLDLINLSLEVNERNIDNLKVTKDIEVMIYGTPELMVMKYCPLKMLENKDKNPCNICDLGNKYYLKNKQDEFYPILNQKHLTYIMHKEALDNTNLIDKYIEKGVLSFRVDLLYEEKDEIIKIIKNIEKKLGM